MRDKQKLKETQHNWYLRKKSGLPTNTRITLTQEERKQHHNESTKQWMKNRNLERQKLYDEIFGNECLICHIGHKILNDKLKRSVLQIHRIDGQKHEIFIDMPQYKLLEELTNHKNEYVRICYKCHKSVHWCMEYLGLNWEQIKSLVTK